MPTPETFRARTAMSPGDWYEDVFTNDSDASWFDQQASAEPFGRGGRTS